MKPNNVPGTTVPTTLGGTHNEFLPWVTSLTGGGRSALDGQNVAGVKTPRVYGVIIGGVEKTFALYEQDGTYTPNGTTIIGPVLANTKVFVLLEDASKGTPIPVDTTSAPVSIALPTNPAVGTRQTYEDPQGTWDTNNLTLTADRTIGGLEENLVCDTKNGSVTLEYVGGAMGWQVFRNS